MKIELSNEETFTQMLELEKSRSFILKGSTGSVFSPPLNDLNDIENELFAITGNENGFVLKGRDSIKALLPSLHETLDDINVKLEKYRTKRKLQGYAPTNEVPAELQNEYSEVLAKIEARKLEVEKLNEMKAALQAKQLETRKNTILQYGLRCNSTDTQPLKEIDGQKTEMVNDILFITDKASPYCGMRVQDYRQLAKEWQHSRKAKEDKDFHSYLRKISKSQLPDWPAYALEHKIEI